jgi:hypothetical protein
MCLNFRHGQRHGSKLVMPSAIITSNKIVITLNPKSTFTDNDAWKYFRYHRLTLVFGAFRHEASTCYGFMKL